MTTRIIIADDQPKVRFALRVLLESNPAIEIVAEVSDGDELFYQVRKQKPDVIILDWLLPALSRAGSIEALKELRPTLFVIALSGRPELGQDALDHGADAFVSKIDPPDRLLAILADKQKGVLEATV